MSDWSKWSRGGVKPPRDDRKKYLRDVLLSEATCPCSFVLCGNTIILRIVVDDGTYVTERHIEAKIRRQRSRIK